MRRQHGAECPCGSGGPYARCCQPLHLGAPAPDAQALMRSRYSAYVLGLEPYLLASWHASTRPERLDLDAAEAPKWLGLEVRRHESGGDEAIVEFVARYRLGGRGHRLHEVSRFLCESGRWLYVGGEFPDRRG